MIRRVVVVVWLALVVAAVANASRAQSPEQIAQERVASLMSQAVDRVMRVVAKQIRLVDIRGRVVSRASDGDAPQECTTGGECESQRYREDVLQHVTEGHLDEMLARMLAESRKRDEAPVEGVDFTNVTVPHLTEPNTRIGRGFVVRDHWLGNSLPARAVAEAAQARSLMSKSSVGVFGIVDELRGDLNVAMGLPTTAKGASGTAFVPAPQSALRSIMESMLRLVTEEINTILPSTDGVEVAPEHKFSSFAVGLRETDDFQALSLAAPIDLTRTEFMLSFYPPSKSKYHVHTDVRKSPGTDGYRPDDRVLTMIYYLNDEWEAARDGGQLRIHQVAEQQLVDVAPIADRLIVFLSRSVPHEVLPVRRSRYAITAWLHY